MNQKAMNILDEQAPIDGTASNMWLNARRAERVSIALKVAALFDAETRIIHVYLGSDRFVEASRQYSMSTGHLHLVALGGFLAERGCSVEGAATVTNFRRGDIGPPRMRILELAPGKTAMVPDDSLLFVKGRGGSRFILKVVRVGDPVEIMLFTTARDAADFFDDWERYAANHGQTDLCGTRGQE